MSMICPYADDCNHEKCFHYGPHAFMQGCNNYCFSLKKYAAHQKKCEKHEFIAKDEFEI